MLCRSGHRITNGTLGLEVVLECNMGDVTYRCLSHSQSHILRRSGHRVQNGIFGLEVISSNLKFGMEHQIQTGICAIELSIKLKTGYVAWQYTSSSKLENLIRSLHRFQHVTIGLEMGIEFKIRYLNLSRFGTRANADPGTGDPHAWR